MKTWEMIKALTENPKLKFVRVSDGVRFTTSTKIEKGEVIDHYVSAIHSPSHECALLNDEWQLVREPVDFMTAVKAFSDRKTIFSVLSDGAKFIYDKKGYPVLRDTSTNAIGINEILNGKWYIED